MKFLKEIRKRVFPSIIALSALSVSASAAFYSVSGLSKLFAGASFEVIVMASSLEVAKLVIASLLYQYWNRINKLLRVYLTIAAMVLVVITSAGIYGFLSAAYQETATKSEIVDSEVKVLELKKDRFSESRSFYIEEKTQLDKSITELRKGLSNNVIQYKDKQTGEIITTTSSSTRKALQNELNDAVIRRDDISIKLESVTDSIGSLEVMILETENGAELASELGPLKYLSELTGKPMNQIINILLLIIIFVFDPLAIALVIAANFSFEQLINKNGKEVEEHPKQEKNDSFGSDSDLSKEAGKIEKKMVEVEPKPLEPSDELIERLQSELDKIDNKKALKEKTNQISDDLLRKIDKLSQMIDLDDDNIDKEEIKEEEENVTPTPHKRTLVYKRRDGGNSSTRFDRI